MKYLFPHNKAKGEPKKCSVEFEIERLEKEQVKVQNVSTINDNVNSLSSDKLPDLVVMDNEENEISHVTFKCNDRKVNNSKHILRTPGSFTGPIDYSTPRRISDVMSSLNLSPITNCHAWHNMKLCSQLQILKPDNIKEELQKEIKSEPAGDTTVEGRTDIIPDTDFITEEVDKKVQKYSLHNSSKYELQITDDKVIGTIEWKNKSNLTISDLYAEGRPKRLGSGVPIVSKRQKVSARDVRVKKQQIDEFRKRRKVQRYHL